MRRVTVTGFEGFFSFSCCHQRDLTRPSHLPSHVRRHYKGSVKSALQGYPFLSVTKLGIIMIWFPQTPNQSVIVCLRWLHYAHL